MDEFEQLQPVETRHIFDMTLVSAAAGGDMLPCQVYRAKLADGTSFTRVIVYPGDASREHIIDVDYWEHVGWIDMYVGEPSVWSDLVAASLDYHNAHRKNA